jgi:hypothetical protein
MRRVKLPALVLSLCSFVVGCAGNEMEMPPNAVVPVLSAIMPASGPTTGGIMLQLDGQNFEPGATVTIAGEAATQVAVTSPTRISLTLPARPGAFGKVAVVVKNGSGQMVARSDLFSYFSNRFEVGPALPFTVGMGPNFVASGDFNGDGKTDIISANNVSDNISVLLGNGQGGLSNGPTVAVGNGPVTAATGDFNKDGKLDLVVVNSGDFNVAILLGNGSGGFGQPGYFDVGARPNGVAVGDRNRNCESMPYEASEVPA